MRLHGSYKLASVMVALLGVSHLAGCAQSADGAGDTAGETAVTIPLTQSAANALYHLTATFEITSADGTVQTVDGGSGDSAVTVNLTAGTHSVRVDDGWTLERSTDGGATFAQVPAFLGSANPVDVVVVPGHTVTLGLEFVVRETTGDLAISFGVIDPPREFVATVAFTSGSGAFAAYQGSTADLVIYFAVDNQSLGNVYEGYYPYYYAYYRSYTSSVNAVEFLRDPQGQLAGLGHDLTNGALSYEIEVHADGSRQFFGSYTSSPAGTGIVFGGSTSATFVGSPGNYPDDVPFASAGSTVQFSQGGSVVLSGQVTNLTAYY